MVSASCLCGKVAWEVAGDLQFMSHCHCGICRKVHGSIFATYALAKPEDFRWLRGADETARYESSPGFFRPFCPACGSVVPEGPDGERPVGLPVGDFDGDPGARPVAHIFVDSRLPWYELPDDGLRRFAEYPGGIETPKVPARPELAPKSRPDAVRGSCLCGGVAYEAWGDLQAIVLCHCSRCRKARSAAHGANLVAQPGNFRWVRGTDLLELHRVPEAKRYAVTFCRRCGSSMPDRDPLPPFLGIPMGTLDDDAPARPRLHIYVGSKAPWYEIPQDGLPRFDELPPGVE